MVAGGAIAGVALLGATIGTPWPAEMAALAFVGFGFYMLHACIQVQATEIAPAARGAAMALHSFFFFTGQALGPVLYGFGFFHLGSVPTMALGALVIVGVGIFCARFLRDRAGPA